MPTSRLGARLQPHDPVSIALLIRALLHIPPLSSSCSGLPFINLPFIIQLFPLITRFVLVSRCMSFYLGKQPLSALLPILDEQDICECGLPERRIAWSAPSAPTPQRFKCYRQER